MAGSELKLYEQRTVDAFRLQFARVRPAPRQSVWRLKLRLYLLILIDHFMCQMVSKIKFVICAFRQLLAATKDKPNREADALAKLSAVPGVQTKSISDPLRS